jgi:hypothetical protein
VPPVPPGFSERLMARIASGDTGRGAAPVEPSLSRQRRASPWRRTSRIVGSLAVFSLATATAAATGFFGEPVYLPVISKALIKAKIVDAPRPAVRPSRDAVAAAATSEAAATASSATGSSATVTSAPLTGSAAIVSRVTELRSDPNFVKLAPREKRAVAGKEIRQIVRSGEASRQDVHMALRELSRDADPARKAALADAIVERREKMIERREQFSASAERIGADQPVGPVGSVVAPDAATAEPRAATDERDILVSGETAKLSPAKIEALRERYRNATPEQRAAMRRALRERRQIRRLRQAQ